MIQHPEVQKKAQEELDRHLGQGQLPEYGDEEALPYCTAIIKELLRWKVSESIIWHLRELAHRQQPIAPMGNPHMLEGDDVYKGYHIPHGSIVIPNVWYEHPRSLLRHPQVNAGLSAYRAILHDEREYPDPFAFKPERFMKDGKLNKAIRDPETAGFFGYGRRVCPGRPTAISSIWIAVVSLLATYEIDKAVDADGKIIEPSGEQHSALINTVKPFPCSFKRRSADIEALIRSTA